jgi:beta-fructofuranosidase
VRADPRWYETLDSGAWREEAFRDPWVFADPGGDGWHMLVTARANHGPADDRGVVGHAWSADLRTWEPRPPLSAPGQGFGHLEVFQVEQVDGRAVLLFSCTDADFSAARRAVGGAGGIWAAQAASVLGPFEIANAQLVTDESLYVGRLLRRRDDGEWVMFAFHNLAPDGSFIGSISDPMPVRWNGRELDVQLEAVPARA